MRCVPLALLSVRWYGKWSHPDILNFPDGPFVYPCSRLSDISQALFGGASAIRAWGSPQFCFRSQAVRVMFWPDVY